METCLLLNAVGLEAFNDLLGEIGPCVRTGEANKCVHW